MPHAFDRSGWIYYNEKGQIHMLKVCIGDQVHELPVSNTNEKTCRRTMRSMFGRLTIYVVRILPDEKPTEET